MEKLAFNVGEAAKAMGVGKNTMYALVKQEGFPALKVGKKYVIPVKPFEAWLSKKCLEDIKKQHCL